MWLVGLYFLQMVGELCLSPVGLSMVTKLSPPRIVGLMMGVWFFATAMGNYVAGWVAGFLGHRSYSRGVHDRVRDGGGRDADPGGHDSDHQATDGGRALKAVSPQRHEDTEESLCSLCLVVIYFPLHAGLRFSVKAIRPSLASAVVISSSR